MSDHNLQPLEPLTDPIDIVVIAAHPDDIEFGTAGSVARWVQQGATVTFVLITKGNAGSNDPDADLEALAQTRIAEQKAAADMLGVQRVIHLGYEDGTLQPTMALRRDLTRILRDIKPYRVVCQDPTTVFARDNYINHPDHRAAGEAAIYATFPSAETRPIFPELLAEGYEPHKVSELYLNLTMNPTHYMDITDTFETKLNALRCHVSQLGSGEDFDNGVRKFITERSLEAGERIGVTHAEMFKVMTLVRPDQDQQAAETAEAAQA